jgi:hypothetical protein
VAVGAAALVEETTVGARGWKASTPVVPATVAARMIVDRFMQIS